LKLAQLAAPYRNAGLHPSQQVTQVLRLARAAQATRDYALDQLFDRYDIG